MTCNTKSTAWLVASAEFNKSLAEAYLFYWSKHSWKIMDICCSICIGPFTSLSDVLATMCGHIFHTGCLNDWFQVKEDKADEGCPQCRKTCLKTHKIYFSAGPGNTKLLEETVQRNNDLEKKMQNIDKIIGKTIFHLHMAIAWC